MKASAVLSQRKPPLKVVRLAPEDFAGTWADRPREGIAVGLRLVSDADEAEARHLASETSRDVDGVLQAADEYNDQLVASIVGAAICDPNDDSRDPPALPIMRDMIRQRLTSRAIRRLYNELDVLAADVSPAAREAGDDEVAELAEFLADPDASISNRARRLLAEVLDELTD
jgi:hypothetical protein